MCNTLLPLLLLSHLLSCLAISIPPPTGRFHVGVNQHVFKHQTTDDPVAPNSTGTSLLLTYYYPTLRAPHAPRPYLDPITAQVFEDAFNYTSGTLSTLTTSLQWQAPMLDGTVGESPYPTLLFGPGGGGPPSVCYTALLSELASHGYTVVALDHPYEQPFLQYPSSGPGIYGLPVVYSFNLTFAAQIYDVRLRDTAAVLNYLPSFVEEIKAPFNTTHFGVFGHSLGGAAALGSMLQSPSIIADINLDGLLFGTPAANTSVADEKRPVMLLGNQEHTPQNESTWATFPSAQSGWWREILVTGAAHLDFSDVAFWKELGVSDTPEIGTIDGGRMIEIVRSAVVGFFNMGFEKREFILNRPSKRWPELEFIGGADGHGIASL